jgi:hypothetical protein
MTIFNIIGTQQTSPTIKYLYHLNKYSFTLRNLEEECWANWYLMWQIRGFRLLEEEKVPYVYVMSV